MKISKNVFFASLVSLLSISFAPITCAQENQAPSSQTSGTPVFLNLTDPSGKFDVTIIDKNTCENVHYDIEGLTFLGCANNLTKFAIQFEKKNIANPGSSAAKGFTFPGKGKEIPELPMGRFCGKNTVTDKYTILMSIKNGPSIQKDSKEIGTWVINLTIKDKEI